MWDAGGISGNIWEELEPHSAACIQAGSLIMVPFAQVNLHEEEHTRTGDRPGESPGIGNEGRGQRVTLDTVSTALQTEGFGLHSLSKVRQLEIPWVQA